MLLLWSFTLVPGKKTPKPKTIYIIHRMQERKKGGKKSLIWQPILADGRKCRFSIFWQSYVVYVDKGETTVTSLQHAMRPGKGASTANYPPGMWSAEWPAKPYLHASDQIMQGSFSSSEAAEGFQTAPEPRWDVTSLQAQEVLSSPDALGSCRGDQKLTNREAF